MPVSMHDQSYGVDEVVLEATAAIVGIPSRAGSDSELMVLDLFSDILVSSTTIIFSFLIELVPR